MLVSHIQREQELEPEPEAGCQYELQSGQPPAVESCVLQQRTARFCSRGRVQPRSTKRLPTGCYWLLLRSSRDQAYGWTNGTAQMEQRTWTSPSSSSRKPVPSRSAISDQRCGSVSLEALRVTLTGKIEDPQSSSRVAAPPFWPSSLPAPSHGPPEGPKPDPDGAPEASDRRH